MCTNEQGKKAVTYFNLLIYIKIYNMSNEIRVVNRDRI
jgi:hypothetical protein